MYGGVVYGRILDTLIPSWWEEAPVQRWVTRRGTVIMTETQALTVDYRTTAWGEAPYNGVHHLPARLRLVARRQGSRGAAPCWSTSTTATGLLRDRAGRIIGVRTDRPDGDLTARLVIACDGVNSFLAKEAGLYPHAVPENFTLGAKEVLALPREEIDKRFGLQGHEGADFEIVGCTQGIAGGGFVYTNLDSIAVGVVLSVTGAGRGQGPPRGAHRRAQAPPDGGAVGRGGGPQGVLRAPHPRGRLRDDARARRPTGCSWPATPRPCAWPPASGSRA